MTTKHMLMAFAAPLALIAAPADAAIFAFDLSGSYTASFTIDSASLAPPASFDDSFFIVNAIAGTFGGVAGTADTLTFYTASFDGGLTIQLGNAFVDFFGGQLFTGTTASPTFGAGTYSLLLGGDTDFAATLRIVEVAASVPEPASWAMMLAGFGVVGYAMRRRRVSLRFQQA
jgi:hypothetical protein